MHILVCDDDAAFSAKVAEYAATYFEAHEIPVQATVCSDPEQVLAIPDLELYRIAFLDVDMPQVNGIALGGQLRHRNPDICLVYVSAYLAFALDRCRCEYTLSCRDRWFRFTCAVPTRKL